MNDEIYSYAYGNNLTCFMSKTIDIKLNKGEVEVRKDFILEEKKILKIWGRIMDCNQNPISGAKITLLELQPRNHKLQYIKIATVLSNYEGFYQFELKESSKQRNYMVNVQSN